METKSIAGFLKTALLPTHRTMYIWGGGWEGSGDLHRIGLNPKWEEFFLKSASDYDFKQHKFEKEHGLDCSGYVGWVMENYLGSGDYVVKADDQAALFAEMGLGKLIKNTSCFMPGDIVSGNGHVYIAVSQCRDGSLILLHSSPPGVQLCAASPLGKNSCAAKAVKCYIKTHCPEWYKKFGCCIRGAEYLRNVTVFRWNESVLK